MIAQVQFSMMGEREKEGRERKRGREKRGGWLAVKREDPEEVLLVGIEWLSGVFILYFNWLFLAF